MSVSQPQAAVTPVCRVRRRLSRHLGRRLDQTRAGESSTEFPVSLLPQDLEERISVTQWLATCGEILGALAQRKTAFGVKKKRRRKLHGFAMLLRQSYAVETISRVSVINSEAHDPLSMIHFLFCSYDSRLVTVMFHHGYTLPKTLHSTSSSLGMACLSPEQGTTSKAGDSCCRQQKILELHARPRSGFDGVARQEADSFLPI